MAKDGDLDLGLAPVLRGVRAAADVERASRSRTRSQQAATAALVNRQLLQALDAGASAGQLAAALNRSIGPTKERLRAATRERDLEVLTVNPPAPIEAEVKLVAPTVWRDVPMCARPAPPPWPVSARCRRDARHEGDHEYQADSKVQRPMGANSPPRRVPGGGV